MGRLLTLTTCQWADMTIEEIAALAKKMGYDGLELACCGNHFDPVRAAEDDAYIVGSPATVILSTSAGVEIKRETTTTFPVSFNISGITGAEDGFIVIVYPVTIPGTTITNENGEIVTTPETVEDRSIRRTVKFAKE